MRVKRVLLIVSTSLVLTITARSTEPKTLLDQQIIGKTEVIAYDGQLTKYDKIVDSGGTKYTSNSTNYVSWTLDFLGRNEKIMVTSLTDNSCMVGWYNLNADEQTTFSVKLTAKSDGYKDETITINFTAEPMKEALLEDGLEETLENLETIDNDILSTTDWNTIAWELPQKLFHVNNFISGKYHDLYADYIKDASLQISINSSSWNLNVLCNDTRVCADLFNKAIVNYPIDESFINKNGNHRIGWLFFDTNYGNLGTQYNVAKKIYLTNKLN